jgi:hypothetical protein
MSCSKHLLGLNWKQHTWERRVTHSESFYEPLTDMWGRRIATGHVTCHAEFVCRDCGAVRDDGECTCDEAKGELCPVRVQWLAAEAAMRVEPHPRRSDTHAELPQIP